MNLIIGRVIQVVLCILAVQIKISSAQTTTTTTSPQPATTYWSTYWSTFWRTSANPPTTATGSPQTATTFWSTYGSTYSSTYNPTYSQISSSVGPSTSAATSTTTSPSTSTPSSILYNGTTGFSSGSIDELFSNVEGISAKCTIPCPTNMNCRLVSGNMLWFSGNSTTSFQNTSLLYDTHNNSLYGYLTETQWLPMINTYISCTAIPYLNGSKLNFSLYTQSYYFGLILSVLPPTKLSPDKYNFFDNKQITLNISEVSQNKVVLGVYSTIPILCRKSESCMLSFSLSRDLSSSRDHIRSAYCNQLCRECSRGIQHQLKENSTNQAMWDILATVETGNLNYRSTTTLLIDLIENSEITGGFWSKLKLPTINIKYLPTNMPMNWYGSSNNDPHMRSFDGMYFEFQGYGDEYLIMENENTLLRIHSIASPCGWFYSFGFLPHAYCNDRIYIQSVDDLITHDVRYNDILYYTDLSKKTEPTKIVIPFDKYGYGIIPKQGGIRVKRSYWSFEITTHFSTTISLDYRGNYVIYPSKLDYQNVWGLLGNYDKNPSNDLNTLKNGSTVSMADVFESYRIKSPRPSMSSGQFYSMNDGVWQAPSSLTKYCMCTKNNGKINSLCRFGLSQIYDANDYDRSGIRSLNVEEKEIDMDLLERLTIRVKNFDGAKKLREELRNKLYRSKRQATDSCESVLNITVFQDCHNQGLINLTKTIESCHLDFNISGSDDWTEQYYQNTLDSCKKQLNNDQNTFVVVNGTTQKQLDVLDNLCSNNCSGNGICLSGVCSCTYPYTADDCSIDRSIPPTIYNSTFANNICDSNNDNCTDLILFLKQITSDITVLYKKYYKKNNNTQQDIDTEQTSSVIFLSRNLLYVGLEVAQQKANGHLSVVYYQVSVKDISSSQPLVYVIYNSSCQMCTNVNDCTIKNGTCDIESRCYKDGEINPDNQNQKCDYQKSQFSWSSVAGSKGLDDTSIALIVVGCIVALGLVATTVSVTVVIFKKKNFNKMKVASLDAKQDSQAPINNDTQEKDNKKNDDPVESAEKKVAQDIKSDV